jgi:hypothetical protein
LSTSRVDDDAVGADLLQLGARLVLVELAFADHRVARDRLDAAGRSSAANVSSYMRRTAELGEAPTTTTFLKVWPAAAGSAHDVVSWDVAAHEVSESKASAATPSRAEVLNVMEFLSFPGTGFVLCEPGAFGWGAGTHRGCRSTRAMPRSTRDIASRGTGATDSRTGVRED